MTKFEGIENGKKVYNVGNGYKVIFEGIVNGHKMWTTTKEGKVVWVWNTPKQA